MGNFIKLRLWVNSSHTSSIPKHNYQNITSKNNSEGIDIGLLHTPAFHQALNLI